MSGKTTVFSHMCTKSSCVHLDLELLALFLLVDGCRVFFFIIKYTKKVLNINIHIFSCFL